jgi:hypothetical protein
MGSIVLFDLDGTLALIEHRVHFIQRPRAEQDWDAFYEACDKDEPNFPVIAVFNALQTSGYTLYILTGRSDQVEEKTRKWLNAYDIEPDEMIMRPAGDFTPDDVLKKRWVEKIGEDNVTMAFEDRDRMASMYRSLGITCLQVADGRF